MNLSEDTKKSLIMTLLGLDEKPTATAKTEWKPMIVVLQRGWVIVGEVFLTDTSCSVRCGHVIRSWGTSKGLGEIALNGPTSNTKLDKFGKGEFHLLTTVLMLDIEASKWSL